MPFKIVGKIIKPYGLKGNLLVKSEYLTFDEFSSLKNLFIGDNDKPDNVFKIESVSVHNSFFNVKLQDFNSIDEIKKIGKTNIFLSDEEFEKISRKKDKKVENFIGFEVFDNNRNRIGEVISLDDYPAQQILTVIKEDNKEIMIPFVKNFINQIDGKKKIITINLLEGLLDDY